MRKTQLFALGIILCAGALVAGRTILKGKLPVKKLPNVSPVASGPYSDESRGPDYSDERILVGHSQNVFVGTVLSKIGSRPPASGDVNARSTSQYSVSVLLNVKGNLRGTVVVNQFENGDPVLQVGSTYVFATTYFRADDFYSIVKYPYDYSLLSDNASLSNAQLKNLAEQNSRVKALQEAYPKEILSGFDIKYNNTLNSYVSRHYDAQGALIDDTVELHKQFEASHGTVSPVPESITEVTPTPSEVPAIKSVFPAPDIAPAQ